MLKKRSGAAESLIVLLIYTIFAITSLMLVMIGANVYKSVVSGIDQTSAVRTSLSYVANKVRAMDGENILAVEERGGVTVLLAREKFGESEYVTYIYHYDGYLRETSLFAEDVLVPENGEKVLKLDSFTIQQQDNVLTIRAGMHDLPAQSLSLKLISQP